MRFFMVRSLTRVDRRAGGPRRLSKRHASMPAQCARDAISRGKPETFGFPQGWLALVRRPATTAEFIRCRATLRLRTGTRTESFVRQTLLRDRRPPGSL